MKKKSFLILSLCSLLVLIAFNVIYFVVPFNREISNGTFWIIYGFTHAFILLFWIISLYFLKSKTRKEKFAKAQLIRNVAIFGSIQFVLCILFLIVGNFIDIPFWIPLVLEIILFTFCTILLLVRKEYSNYIVQHDMAISKGSEFISCIRKELYELSYKNKEKELKKPLEKLCELSCYTDPISKNNSEIIEKDIICKVGQLRVSINSKNTQKSLDLIYEITHLFNQRKGF